MQITQTKQSDTRIKLTIEADQELLEEVRTEILRKLARNVKVQGFRAGKAPLQIVEKNIDQQAYQSEFLDAALNRMYGQALAEGKIRPVSQPKVELKKFVPFTTLEFEAEVDVVGDVKLTDYKNVSVQKQEVTVTDDDVEQVVDNLRLRMAEKQDVERASKEGDEVWIDFAGRDAKTDEPISGGDGKDYPLALGSKTFIPGFEENLVGLKPGEEKEFTLDFPKDYGVKSLQGRSVTFKTTVKKVREVVKPEVNDDFAAKIGPFKTVDELKTNIREQVVAERRMQADRDFENALLTKITEQSEVDIPDSLIEDELDRLDQEERQNVLYRGQTWQEHLDAEGVTEEEHRAKNRPGAEMRVKAGLVLAEIAEQEKIDVTSDEVAVRRQLLKGQYTDEKMQAEIEKPENQREIASRILSEKTIERLVGYAADASGKSKKASK